jgi:hypothetical protein
VDPVSCDTENGVYYWKCVNENCQDYQECEYIEMICRTFKQRMSDRDYPKRDVLTEPSGEHFTKRGHNVAHLKGQVLEKVKNRNQFVLKSKEAMLIKKFDTFRHGLNKEACKLTPF